MDEDTKTSDEVRAEKERFAKRVALAFAASQMGIVVAVGLLGGLWLDRRFDTMPLFGLLGLVGGFGSGIFLLIRLVRRG